MISTALTEKGEAMKQRLIDANALDKRIYNDIPISVFGSIKKMAAVREIIAEQPTVDAVPVIRCSKCRMSYIADESMEMYGAEIGKRYCSSGRKVSDDFFCADGKRKDGEK
jgi:hypothetical protein